MFGNKKLKKEIKKLVDYSILTRTILDGHVKLTLEFVDVIKEKLNALAERVATLETKKKVKRKRRSKKRVIVAEKKQPKKVFGFQVKTKRKRRKKNAD